MTQWSNIRREYGNLGLLEENVLPCPLAQFERWFSEILKSETSDPTAMVVSTVDNKGHPDSRVVLLKGIIEGAFVFYTNYESAKGYQLLDNPFCALNFYWPQTARQVRVRGQVQKTTAIESDTYFNSRPKTSQLSALASSQSQILPNRTILEHRLNELILEYEKKLIHRPSYWGGYCVLPYEMEFWQGRDNRLHDRIQFKRDPSGWSYKRLAP